MALTPTFVSAGGLRLRVARQGTGRPLLLVTGIGANLDVWAPFARRVTDRERVAFDPPGSGLSRLDEAIIRPQSRPCTATGTATEEETPMPRRSRSASLSGSPATPSTRAGRPVRWTRDATLPP